MMAVRFYLNKEQQSNKIDSGSTIQVLQTKTINNFIIYNFVYFLCKTK